MAIVVKKHDCKHDYQDKIYGKGMRVINVSTKNSKEGKCTVCGKIVKL